MPLSSLKRRIGRIFRQNKQSFDMADGADIFGKDRERFVIDRHQESVGAVTAIDHQRWRILQSGQQIVPGAAIGRFSPP